MLKPFLGLFDVTRGMGFTAFGSSVSVYFLRPEEHTRTMFGLEQEILLVYSPYASLERRITQLAEHCMTVLPARGRVDTLCYILVSDDPETREKVTDILTSSVETKMIIPFHRDSLTSNRSDQWLVRNRLYESLFSRDLFDITQPMVEATYYFGRQQFLADLIDRFRRGQNTGLFGLRKTGKTSTIFKIIRQIKAGNHGIPVMIDGNDPANYVQRWWELLFSIVNKVSEESGVPLPVQFVTPPSERTGAQFFNSAMDYLTQHIPDGRIMLIMDEIEHISPETSKATHWNEDFVPFWQSLRAYQTRVPRVTFLLVGVNPRAVEMTTIGKIDNPIFGLIPHMFLPMFDRIELRDMVRTLGRYMGMKFDEDCYEYMRRRYGGHPMLIRLSCSWMHKYLVGSGSQRPLNVTLSMLRATQDERDASLAPYARHILEVLSNWYPLEYDLLEMICQGHSKDYADLVAQDPDLHRHLTGYGLVSGGDKPQVRNDFVAEQMARQVNRGSIEPAIKSEEPRVVKPESEPTWSAELEQLSDTVVHSRAFCVEIAVIQKAQPVFVDDKVRIGVKLADLRVTPLSGTRTQFQDTVNTLNQIFYEAIPPAFRATAQKEYPSFYKTADTIRALRHWLHHNDLSDLKVKTMVMETITTVVGGFPSSKKDWETLHLFLMRNLVTGLREVQQQLYLHSTTRTTNP